MSDFDQPREVTMVEQGGQVSWEEPLPRAIAVTDVLFRSWMTELNDLRAENTRLREMLDAKALEAAGAAGARDGLLAENTRLRRAERKAR